MILIKDVTYVAGLLEGEGCFQFSNSPTIRLSMTDKDIVTKARNLMKVDRIIYAHKSDSVSRNRWKQKYTLTLHGNIAIQWMMTIYSLMGERRKAKIKEIIYAWKQMKHSDT